MTFTEWIALIIGAGIVTTVLNFVGGLVFEWYKGRREKSSEDRQRSNKTNDERLGTKKRIYNEMLNVMNFAVFHRMNGGGNYALSIEEANKRAKLIADVGIYGSSEVKEISARVAGHLAIEKLNETQQIELVQTMRELTDQVRSEIGH